MLTSPLLRTAPVSFCVGPSSLCRVAGGREPSDVLDGPASPGGSTAFRVSTNLSLCLSYKLLQLFDCMCKYHVSLWCMLYSGFCLGGEERI